MTDVFLSYNREDQARARHFAEALRAEGFSVWWDVGLRTGEAYDEATEAALRAAKAVIVLWSKKAVASRWVRAEATLALRNQTLFPCMIEPCERPIMFELTQTADLTHWQGATDDPAWRAFVAELRRFIDRPPGALTGEAAAPQIVSAAPPPRAQRLAPALDRRMLMIAGVAAAGAVGGGVFILKRPPVLAHGVAVLPFRNLSGDPGKDYLSLGLSSEVRSALARNPALRVVAQASCEAIKQRAIGAAEMAKALAISFILDGNVSQTSDRLRVDAELIDGRSGFSRWSQSFVRPFDELSTVQDAIADAVTRQLAADQPVASENNRFGGTGNAAAFNDYLKGNELYASARSLEADLEALALFDHAIGIDAGFGAAHAARARSLTSLGNTSDNVRQARAYYEDAQKSAKRAVELGPDSADAHSTLGYVLFQAQLRVADAREPYQRAFELGAGDAAVLARFAVYAAATKRIAEAKKAVFRARELDPFNATIHRGVGFVLYAAGDFEGSIAPVRRAIEINPELSDSHARVAMAMIALGRPKDALVEAEKEKSGMVRFPAIAIAQRLVGDDEAAAAAMARLTAQYGDAGLYQQAQILSRWGEADKAMAVLFRARELGDSGLTYAYMDPTLDPLRSRADFNQLLKALGFV